MSVYGDQNHRKNDLLEEIESYGRLEDEKDISDIIEDLLEIVGRGISTIVYERDQSPIQGERE